MSTPTHPRDVWTDPSSGEEQPEAGYDAWLAEEIAAGCAELDGGAGIPADEVWKQLGVE